MRVPDLCIEHFQPKDFQAVIDLLQRELHADYVSESAFQQQVLLDPNFRPEGALVAKLEGRVVGFMLGIHRKQPLEDAVPDLDRGWITLMAVDSEFQRRGIGGLLLDGVCAYLKSEGATSIWVSPYAPNYFAPGVDESAYPGAITFLEKHGFSTAYRPLSMTVSLLELEIPAWAGLREAELRDEGIAVGPFAPDYTLPLTELLRSDFPGDWQRLMRDAMARIVEEQSPADEMFVAMEGGKCIGFCRHEGERFGPFGVPSSHRGRGIGAVLLYRCLGSMKWKGFYRAWFMWTDDKAAELYRKAGFVETRRFSVMRRAL